MVLFVYVGLFLGDDPLRVSHLGDGKLLHPAVAGVALDVVLAIINMLIYRIDLVLFAAIGHLCDYPERDDLVSAVGLDLFGR